jgi:hypothetical protein
MTLLKKLLAIALIGIPYMPITLAMTTEQSSPSELLVKSYWLKHATWSWEKCTAQANNLRLTIPEEPDASSIEPIPPSLQVKRIARTPQAKHTQPIAAEHKEIKHSRRNGLIIAATAMAMATFACLSWFYK